MGIIAQAGTDLSIEKLTIPQAAEMMGVCERTVRNWRKQGLRIVKIGRKCWILLEDLRAFMEAHRTAEGA